MDAFEALDMDMFIYKLIHLCCRYTDESYIDNAKEAGVDFSKTLKAVKEFDALRKMLITKVLKETPFHDSFETLKYASAVQELDNGVSCILFLTTEKKDKHHISLKKEDLSYYKSFFEIAHFEKCVCERYLSFHKQIEKDNNLFSHFAWSEWQDFSNHISVLIKLLCTEKTFL
ncbi:MAG: hypothetical protein CMH46_00520 [Muricauda sp.]|jgi:hypothetical protein|nr:hypothetical protein [Allomuricauda sp.]MAU14007.1 hypothetical protein [Allomuricauda sp.]